MSPTCSWFVPKDASRNWPSARRSAQRTAASRRNCCSRVLFSLCLGVCLAWCWLIRPYGFLLRWRQAACRASKKSAFMGLSCCSRSVSLVASLLFGSIPVLKYAGRHLGTGLRQGGRSMSESRERHRSRSVLVVVQVALALVLLVSSGLMIRTFHALTRVDPGFVAPSQLQTFRVNISETDVKDPEQVVRVEEEVSHKIEAVPGVSSVGLSMSVPMDGNGWEDTVFAKDRTYSPGDIPLHRFRFVAPGFFKALGTPLVAGRDFTWG